MPMNWLFIAAPSSLGSFPQLIFHSHDFTLFFSLVQLRITGSLRNPDLISREFLSFSCVVSFPLVLSLLPGIHTIYIYLLLL